MRINKSMQRPYLFISLQLATDIGKVQSNIAAGAITTQGNATCDIKVAVDQNIATAADSQVALGFNLALFIVTIQQVGATAHVRAISQCSFHGADGDVTGFGSCSLQPISMIDALRGHCLVFILNLVFIRFLGLTIAIVNTRNNNRGAFSLFAHCNQLAIDS